MSLKKKRVSDLVDIYDRCLITKDGILFDSMYSLKEFIDMAMIEVYRNAAVDKINIVIR